MGGPIGPFFSIHIAYKAYDGARRIHMAHSEYFRSYNILGSGPNINIVGYDISLVEPRRGRQWPWTLQNS